MVQEQIATFIARPIERKEKSNDNPELNTSALQSKNAVCANITHSIDTSIKHQISGQSTSMLKGYMYIMFDMVDTAFSYGRALIVC